jgi:hypothetical protein
LQCLRFAFQFRDPVRGFLRGGEVYVSYREARSASRKLFRDRASDTLGAAQDQDMRIQELLGGIGHRLSSPASHGLFLLKQPIKAIAISSPGVDNLRNQSSVSPAFKMVRGLNACLILCLAVAAVPCKIVWWRFLFETNPMLKDAGPGQALTKSEMAAP